jgi:hypothetical protein
MTTITTRLRVFAPTLLLSFLGLACGGPSINPKTTQARSALETSLDAWRAGKKPIELARADPPVQIADNEWNNGRKLASYEILREEPSSIDKRFAVKLTYAGSADASEVRYIILGAQPLLVFREEDYARTLNMDNNPTAVVKRRRR